jgi:hypothetical protein
MKMITIPIPILTVLILLALAQPVLLYLQFLLIRNRNEMIATNDRLIVNYQTINKCNDRIIQLQEEQIRNAERRATNYEYLYNIARNNCEVCLKAPAEQAENA